MEPEIVVYEPKTFEPLRENMLKLVKKEEIFLREVSFALQALNANPFLARCTQSSIMAAVYNTATTGLSLNPILKFAALVPRYVKGKYLAVLDPMYQGLVKLVTDTGSVKSCYAYCVYEGDDFSPTYGTSVGISHTPKFTTKNITHAYAVAVLPDDKMQVEIMDKADLDYIRGMSESYKSWVADNDKPCIWVAHPGEMCKKTVLKRLVKYLPKTDQYEHLASAIDLDNKDYQVSDNQEDYLLSLLRNSSYGKDDTGEMLEKKILAGLTGSQYETIKNDLLNNQLDPIRDGLNYNQSDIKSHIKKLK